MKKITENTTLLNEDYFGYNIAFKFTLSFANI